MTEGVKPAEVYVLKVYRSAHSRQISVAKLFPPTWRYVFARIVEKNKNKVTVEFKPVLTDEG